MPKKYHLKPKPALSRSVPPGPFGIIEGDGCLNCSKCVKKACAYDVYQKRVYDAQQMTDTADSLCKNCFRCVQECYARVLSKSSNPEYWSMGDDYWTPEIIGTNQRQAETGKIPVSGGGYGGPFSGPGFDSMWTDMSEIVRPTRDGIHGREYISTATELGRASHPAAIRPSGDAGKGEKIGGSSRVEIAIPFLFDLLPFQESAAPVRTAVARAAKEVNTLMVLPAESITGELAFWTTHLVPLLPPGDPGRFRSLIQQCRMVQILRDDETPRRMEEIKACHPEVIVSVRLPLTPRAEEEVELLLGAGAEVIHLVADAKGREQEASNPRFVKDGIRSIHQFLVKKGLRDQVTLIFGGGIGLAEHVAKAIICGADAVSVERPLLLSLDCRLCGQCKRGEPCPVGVGSIEPGWGRQRVVNLIAAWHGQLLEVLGAMGMRDVRRLRGEIGRAIFREDIERETFGQIFGERTKSRRPAAQSTQQGEEVRVLAT
jgi:ferredoxin